MTVERSATSLHSSIVAYVEVAQNLSEDRITGILEMLANVRTARRFVGEKGCDWPFSRRLLRKAPSSKLRPHFIWHIADNFLMLCSDLLYDLANGAFDIDKLDEKQKDGVRGCLARGIRVDQRRVVKLEDAGPGAEGVFVHLQDDDRKIERVLFGFLVHKPRTELNAQALIRQFGLETSDGMVGKVLKTSWPTQQTNVAGVYATGDSSAMMTHFTVAVTSGIQAAGGITGYLNSKDSDDVLTNRGEQRVLASSAEGQAGCRN